MHLWCRVSRSVLECGPYLYGRKTQFCGVARVNDPRRLLEQSTFNIETPHGGVASVCTLKVDSLDLLARDSIRPECGPDLSLQRLSALSCFRRVQEHFDNSRRINGETLTPGVHNKEGT